MKNLKIILLSIIALFATSCDLDEDPIFLDSNAVYTDINVAKGALDGIYQSLTSYNAQERRIFAVGMIANPKRKKPWGTAHARTI